ncbi:hypothetical protein DH2020_009856 [Rehmannia glutinosa]|uniref:Protein kinase domain-containing protein n=1 Tax=Rehmannia glutinosa TaxID=99300 RepID=A0ABR0X7H1_REHGL
MSAIYDNWERLVAAVLKKEQIRELGRAEVATSIGSLATSFSFGSSLPTGDLSVSPAYYSRDVQKLHKNEEPVSKNHFLQFQFNSLAFGYEESGTDRRLIETLIGKEKFLIPYTSVMYNGITTVVKRLRGAEKNVATHNESYFSYKDEMLIFYEYQISQESVSTMLHGKKPGMYQLLDWESRVRIAIAVAKAIANTHEDINDTDKTFPNSQNNDVFSDLGLENMARASIVISTAGYTAPEIDGQPSVGQESDIYSFGVFLLELLTGAFPRNGSVVSRRRLVRWVIHKFVEVGTLIVFEFVPVRSPSALVQMWKMLLLAMRCVEENPKERPKLADVVKMMDDITMCPS